MEIKIVRYGRINEEGRQTVCLTLNGLEYLGLLSTQDKERHVFIPSIHKTFVLGKDPDETF